jgi:hypothetical protein
MRVILATLLAAGGQADDPVLDSMVARLCEACIASCP